jgi:WD40 repeat protein
MTAARRRLLPTLALLLLAPVVRAEPPARTDAQGDPLPAGALLRIGTIRFRDGNFSNVVALSPDGKTLAVAGGNQGVRLLDLATGKELRTLKVTGFANFTHVNFSPDGKLLGAGDFTGRMEFWDPATGDSAGKITPPPPGGGLPRTTGGNFSFSGDGKYVAVGSENVAFNVQPRAVVYEVATGKQTADVGVIHNNAVRAFLSRDGKVLVTTGQYYPRGGIEPPEKQAETNATVEVWDAATGKELHKLRAEGTIGATVAAFSPDGKQLAVVNAGGGVVLWDPAAGKELRRLAGRRNLNAFVAYSPDGKTLAAGSLDGAVQTWDVASGKRLGLYEVPRTLATRATFTTTGRLLACGTTGQAISVWDVLAEKSLTPTGGHEVGITSIGFAPDGKGLVTASADGAVYFWDAAGKEARHVQLRPGEGMMFTPASFRMGTIQLAPDQKHVLGSYNNGLSLYELSKGREVCSFSTGFLTYNPTATFSRDGSLLVEGWNDSRTRKPAIALFDVATGRELRRFEGQTGDLRQLSLSPDGKTVAAASNNLQPTGQVNDVRAWDAATGKSLWHVEGGAAMLQGLTFSPDGKLLATADPFGALTFYDAVAGREVRRVAAQPGSNNASALTFSPDGRLLALSSFDFPGRKAAVRVYEVAAGVLRREFTGHTGPVTALAFSPDRKRLASGSNDTTVLLWDLTAPDEEVATGKPTAEELDRLWAALADSDGRAAFKAMRRLASASDEAAALLAKHVKAAGGGEGDAIAKLIAALDDDRFDVREAAQKDLLALGKSAEEPLKKALAAKPSAEVKRAIEYLLDKLKDKGQGPPADLVRALRAVEVLEDLGTPEAKKVLEELAKGGADAPQTAAAKEALGRLERAGKP